ncbi:SRPBCC domain-containing protein [Aurantibacillus circumpalustris]|uniref:SRPBCC domain-containing protein n=1 Tax=Aurantibacillus circumpalustris TaxID=3036359 RepID=UPI00295B0BC3|nr:SRPBCC domain-containing protein [Aurantibacillus circumpalustris]
MAKEIKTEILILASPEKVWNILTDFKIYPNWNPFIKFISGDPKAYRSINVTIQPPEKKAMKFSPKVLVYNLNKEFRWKGHFIIPGIFDGEHIFELINNKNGSTTFIQREVFGGILVPLLTKMLDVNTKNGFNLMNEKLKEQAESTKF